MFRSDSEIQLPYFDILVGLSDSVVTPRSVDSHTTAVLAELPFAVVCSSHQEFVLVH